MSATFLARLPNILTAMRAILAIIICLLMFFDYHTMNIIAVILACVASLTDYFDGKIARKYNASSSFGRCMDPIADKIFVTGLIVMLIYLDKAWVFSGIIILFREFIISGIREFLAKEKHLTIPVSKLAKWKTFTQMGALLILMLCGHNNFIMIFGNIMLTLAAGLSVLSGWHYIKSVISVILH